MAERRLFACGMKGWVQIREGRQPPKVKESKVTIRGLTKRVVWEASPDSPWGTGRAVMKEFPTKQEIKMVSFKGGKLLGCVKEQKFKRETGITLPRGVMIELLDKVREPFNEFGGV